MRRQPLPSLPFLLATAFVVASPTLAAAQKVPRPESTLGFTLGADFHLASYQQAIEYFRALEKASPMIRLIEIGTTSMGKPMIAAIITSADNMKKLDRLREISQRLALADGLSDEEARKLAAEGRAVVYIDGGLHATEVAPAQHNLQLAYDLLTSDDADTRLILDNTILLLDFANPDGMDMVADWYMHNVGTPFEVSTLPRLYHLYAGHDNNRDAFMLNLKETRNILGLQNRVWYPVVQINHHQTAPFPTRISIPPLPEPVNPNVHPLLTRWKNLLGAAMGAAFDRNGQPGAISRIVIDGWAPEMLDAIGDLFHTMSTSPETALYLYATPRQYTVNDFPEDYRDFTPSIFYPNPWKGGWWRLKDAMDYVLTCSKSALHMAAVYREKLLYDKYRMGKDVITRYQGEAPYAWIVPQDQWDPPVAALMLNRMAMLGIKLYRATASFESGGATYAEGTWVVPMQQPFAAYVKSMFEEQRYPDLAQYPALWQGIVRPQKFPNAYLPPYDTAGWTLPYQLGVKVVAATEPLKATLAPIENASPRAGRVEGDPRGVYLLSPQAMAASSLSTESSGRAGTFQEPGGHSAYQGSPAPPGRGWFDRPAFRDRSSNRWRQIWLSRSLGASSTDAVESSHGEAPEDCVVPIVGPQHGRRVDPLALRAVRVPVHDRPRRRHQNERAPVALRCAGHSRPDHRCHRQWPQAWSDADGVCGRHRDGRRDEYQDVCGRGRHAGAVERGVPLRGRVTGRAGD